MASSTTGLHLSLTVSCPPESVGKLGFHHPFVRCCLHNVRGQIQRQSSLETHKFSFPPSWLSHLEVNEQHEQQAKTRILAQDVFRAGQPLGTLSPKWLEGACCYNEKKPLLLFCTKQLRGLLGGRCAVQISAGLPRQSLVEDCYQQSALVLEASKGNRGNMNPTKAQFLSRLLLRTSSWFTGSDRLTWRE